MIGRLNRRAWAWRAVALVPGIIVAQYIADTGVLTTVRLEALVVLLVTLTYPAAGLVLVALLAPLGDAVVPLLGTAPARHAETIVLAFLAGWLSSRASEEDAPRTRLPDGLVDAMWIFGGVVVASVAGTAVHLARENPAELRHTLDLLSRSYLTADDIIGAHTAAQLLEGLGLLAATALVASRPRERGWIRLSIVAAGVIASVTSGLLGLHIAPTRTLSRYAFVGKRRFSAITGDVNAAGSSYLLYLGVTAGIAAMAWPNHRRVWLAATAIVLTGLVITGSAAALAAAAIVLAIAAVRRVASTPSRRRRLAGGLVLATVIIGAIVFAASDRSTRSLEMRGGFTQASLRFIAARPVLGIGAGRYYPLSMLVLPPDLSWVYGRENAHNYFLQIFAELGLVGLAAFGWVLAGAMGPALELVWRRRADVLTGGCVAGASAYLVTSLTGHPFLVPETAIPFWLVIGLLVADQPVPAARRSRRRPAVLAFAGVLLLTVPLRPEIPAVRVANNGDGFGDWQYDSGSRQPFHQAGLRASLFVGPTIRAVEIPVRKSGTGGGSIVITASEPGVPFSDVRVGHDWGTIVVRLPGAELMMPRQRINLAITAASGVPATDDLRMDVGQVRIVTAE